MPSKSKLDRNPPKKKGNSELLINGTEGDAVFNATADTRPVNTDGQFLMNNVNEGRKPVVGRISKLVDRFHYYQIEFYEFIIADHNSIVD